MIKNRIYLLSFLLLIVLTSCDNDDNQNNANNKRPACVNTTSLTRKLEYDCMDGSIQKVVNNENVSFYFNLDDVYWDAYVYNAYQKANMSLDYRSSETAIERSIIDTDDGDETSIKDALQIFVNNHNSFTDVWGYVAGVEGISSDNFAGGSNAGFTYRSSTPRWSFVFVGYIINNQGTDYIKNTKRLVVAHEIGHMNGIPVGGHDAHGGNGADCCFMHKPVPYTNCSSTLFYFCDDHACYINHN